MAGVGCKTATPRKLDDESSLISSLVLAGSRARGCDICRDHRQANTKLGLNVFEPVALLGAVKKVASISIGTDLSSKLRRNVI
jgi:hypothetical protein